MDAMPLVRNYVGLRDLLNDRRVELRLSMLELDHLGNLPEGYSAKILGGTPRAGVLSRTLLARKASTNCLRFWAWGSGLK
jgi:hypothetical protein